MSRMTTFVACKRPFLWCWKVRAETENLHLQNWSLLDNSLHHYMYTVCIHVRSCWYGVNTNQSTGAGGIDCRCRLPSSWTLFFCDPMIIFLHYKILNLSVFFFSIYLTTQNKRFFKKWLHWKIGNYILNISSPRWKHL